MDTGKAQNCVNCLYRPDWKMQECTIGGYTKGIPNTAWRGLGANCKYPVPFDIKRRSITLDINGRPYCEISWFVMDTNDIGMAYGGYDNKFVEVRNCSCWKKSK